MTALMYALGVLLLFLAYRILRGVDESVDPGKSFFVRMVRKVFPVSEEFHGPHFFTQAEGRREATPLLLALVSIVAADIAFARIAAPSRESAIDSATSQATDGAPSGTRP